ncbi:GNAT family N-acetyltransferase [Pseudonocardia xishanensis]|uniref:BioF2-like acetyltransferase domain-containing protein n=1 Tax=Pseudonocardia xishanensis TaxID=630995 RepID=A0ABP8RUF7_9PSEU
MNAPHPAVVSPVPRAVWREVFEADPDAVATQAPEWADCLADRGYTDAGRLYTLPDGRRLVLPLVARGRAGLAVSEESWPYGWGYGGLLSDGGAPTREDCALVLADLARRPALLRAVTPMPLRGAAWLAAAPPGARTVPYTAQVVDLDGGFDAVWNRYRRQARNSVRKAERFELDVRREDGSTADPRGPAVFRELYAASVDRWAAQRGQPLALARMLAARRDRPGQVALAARALGARCVVWSVLRAGEPVAANVVLQHGAHAIGWLCAMQADLARETLATYLLHSVAIADACAAGVRWFHMGESDSGSGGEHFKRYFGASPVEYAAVRLERLPLSAAERRARAAYAALSAGTGRLRARRSSPRAVEVVPDRRESGPAADSRPRAGRP